MSTAKFDPPQFWLRLLLLEDRPDDALLVEKQIQVYTNNYQIKCVSREREFKEQIESFKPHIILADFRLPSVRRAAGAQDSQAVGA